MWITVLRDVDFGVKQGFTGRQVGFDYVDGYGKGKHWRGLWSNFVIEFFGIGERQMRKLLGETDSPKPKPDPRNSKLYKQGWNDHAAQYGGSKRPADQHESDENKDEQDVSKPAPETAEAAMPKKAVAALDGHSGRKGVIVYFKRLGSVKSVVHEMECILRSLGITTVNIVLDGDE